MYHIGEKIAHPMHGAGTVEDIVEQRVGGEVRRYYVMRMTCGTMTVLIPCHTADTIGVRKIIDPQQADALVESFAGITVDHTQNWNKRYRDNMLKIKSGDLHQVAVVVKSLAQRDTEKMLSTGERKMLSSARQILVSELMLAKDAEKQEIEHMIDMKVIGI